MEGRRHPARSLPRARVVVPAPGCVEATPPPPPSCHDVFLAASSEKPAQLRSRPAPIPPISHGWSALLCAGTSLLFAGPPAMVGPSTTMVSPATQVETSLAGPWLVPRSHHPPASPRPTLPGLGAVGWVRIDCWTKIEVKLAPGPTAASEGRPCPMCGRKGRRHLARPHRGQGAQGGRRGPPPSCCVPPPVPRAWGDPATPCAAVQRPA